MNIVLQKGLALAVKGKDKRNQGIFLSRITIYHKLKYQTDSGLTYAHKAIPILVQQKEWKWVSQTMYMKCMFYLDNKDQVNAIQELVALIRLNDKYNEHEFTGLAYNLLANTFRRLNDTLNEKKYILKHLEFAEKQNSDYHRQLAFEMYGTFLVTQQKFRTAHTYYKKSYILAKRQKDEQMEAETLLSMGANLISLKEYNKSRDALRLAEKISLRYQHLPGWNAILSTDYAHISSLLLATGEPGKALEYAGRSLTLIENDPLRYDFQIIALKNQVVAQKAMGHYQQALYSYERLQKIIHSIDLNKDREITKGIEAKYQLEKIQKEKALYQKSLQIKDLELQNEEKQGRILWILLVISVLALGGGYWLFRKNKLYNQRISKKKEQLEALNETKDKLFGIIGHDLRAPVADLSNILTLIENNYPNLKNEINLFGHLQKNAIKLQTLVNNLVYWALSQRSQFRANPRKVLLEDGINSALELLQGAVDEKHLRVLWNTSADTLLFFDENHLQIVLYNILQNAVKFSPLNDVIGIDTVSCASFVKVHIINAGRGFEWDGSIEHLSNLPGQFGTLNEKGTGLGLLVCAEMMQLNGGSIRAHASENKTTLILTFSKKQA